MELEFEWQCLATTVYITVLLERNSIFIWTGTLLLPWLFASALQYVKRRNTNTITWLMLNSINIEPSQRHARRSYCKRQELRCVSLPQHMCTVCTHRVLEFMSKFKQNKTPLLLCFLQLCSRWSFACKNPMVHSHSGLDWLADSELLWETEE